MQLSDAHLSAIQCFMSAQAPSRKADALLASLGEGATRQDIAGFLARQRTLQDLLAFIAAYREDRPTLPLTLNFHIKQYLDNPLMNDDTLPVECNADMCSPWTYRLPFDLKYVYQRLSTGRRYHTATGFVLEDSNQIREMQTALADASDTDDSIWRTNVAILGMRYMGMGHSEILAFLFADEYSECLFVFIWGGSNGYDRADNFKAAADLTTTTIHRVTVDNLVAF